MIVRYRLARPALVLAAACLAVLITWYSASGAMDPAAKTATSALAMPASSSAVYYVSLGDSLAQGVQPVSNGGQHNTDQGYVDDVYAHYHSESKFKGSLTMVKLGCSGETTASMITGSGSPCWYQDGSQLNQAVAFIRAHKSRIALITINIGGNDISCVSPTSFYATCANNGLATVSRNLPKILSALRKAAGPKTVISGMSYYDPWLAYYLLGAQGETVAKKSLTLVEDFNLRSANAFKTYNVKRAAVQAVFDTTDEAKTGGVPLNVARICEWTWMCAAAPVGPNMHGNPTGYRQIAGAFERIIGVLAKP
jgi:lysophospholipase L1-like esterase